MDNGSGLYFMQIATNVLSKEFVIGFPRDKTSRCPFVPGQKYFLVPLSLCPGTRAGAKILGQTPGRPGSKSLSPKNPQKTGKGCSKAEKDVLKQKNIF